MTLFGEIAEEVLREIEEKEKNQINEYYKNISNDKGLGFKVSLYGVDRDEYTPHLHVQSTQNPLEIEVSLIDFKIIKKKGKVGKRLDELSNDLYKNFMDWVCRGDNYLNCLKDWLLNNETNKHIEKIKDKINKIEGKNENVD